MKVALECGKDTDLRTATRRFSKEALRNNRVITAQQLRLGEDARAARSGGGGGGRSGNGAGRRGSQGAESMKRPGRRRRGWRTRGRRCLRGGEWTKVESRESEAVKTEEEAKVDMGVETEVGWGRWQGGSGGGEDSGSRKNRGRGGNRGNGGSGVAGGGGGEMQV